jgi:hypothetical protein
MGKRTQPDMERQPPGRGSHGRGGGGTQLSDARGPFAVEEDVPAHPPWYLRIRGAAGLAVLVAILGVLTAIAFTVLVVLLVVVAVSTIA